MTRRVRSKGQEGSSIVLTSNRWVLRWPEVFGDHAIATAIPNRLLHHSHVLDIKGRSYPLRDLERAVSHNAG